MFWHLFCPWWDKNEICPWICGNSRPNHERSWLLASRNKSVVFRDFLTLGERTLSFCSIVNNFSSENNILSKTFGLARDNSALLLSSRFCFIAVVSKRTFLLFSDLSPRSLWTTLLSVLSLISKSPAIFLIEHRGFRTILFCNFAFKFLVRMVGGRPVLGLSSTLQYHCISELYGVWISSQLSDLSKFEKYRHSNFQTWISL